jgi:hypothetical protein
MTKVPTAFAIALLLLGITGLFSMSVLENWEARVPHRLRKPYNALRALMALAALMLLVGIVTGPLWRLLLGLAPPEWACEFASGPSC